MNKYKLTSFGFAVACSLSSLAYASGPKISECLGRNAKDQHLIRINFIDQTLDAGGRLEIADVNTRQVGAYEISSSFSPNFADLAFGLEYHGGHSFNFLRLVKSQIGKGPYRLQSISGTQIAEIQLQCR